MEKQPFFSVIIPTHNRASWLSKNLACLLEQQYPKSHFEVIVVDNGSTDETRTEVENLIHLGNSQIHYFYEPKPGSNIARNAGAKHSQGEILAFIDDDAYPDSKWLHWLSWTFRENENVIAVSGRIDLDWEIPKPVWLPEKYETYLGSNRRLGLAQKVIPPSESVFEGNVAIRKPAFERVRGFNTQFGVIGNKIGAHDGTILLDQLRFLGKIIYQPHAVVYHYVPVSKVQPVYFLKRGFFQGRGDAMIDQSRQPRDKVGLVYVLTRDVYVLLKEVSLFFLSILKPSRKNILEKLIVIFTRLGVIQQRCLLVIRGK